MLLTNNWRKRRGADSIHGAAGSTGFPTERRDTAAGHVGILNDSIMASTVFRFHQLPDRQKRTDMIVKQKEEGRAGLLLFGATGGILRLRLRLTCASRSARTRLRRPAAKNADTAAFLLRGHSLFGDFSVRLAALSGCGKSWLKAETACNGFLRFPAPRDRADKARGRWWIPLKCSLRVRSTHRTGEGTFRSLR